MPSGKSKEDTWKAADLEKSIKDSKDERRRHRDKDKDRHRDKDRDKERDKHRDKERDRHHDKHRDKDQDRHRDKDRERDKHRDKDRDRDRHHERDKEHRRDKDRHRDDDRKERRHKERDGEKTRHRDEDKKDRHRKDEGEHHRQRDEKGRRSKHHDEDGHHRDKEERRHHKDRDEERHHRDRDDDRSQRHRDRDEDEKRKQRKHEEEKEKRRRDKEEEERLEKERKKKEQAEDEYDYEDDFEDYDDDFEDDDDGGDGDGDKNDTASYNSTECSSKGKQFSSDMGEILEAMNKENERLLVESRRSNWSEENEEKPRKRQVASTTPTFINFVSAKQRQMSKKAMGKAALRGYELQQMIEFDVTEYDLFDMPPVTEYTIYMRSFGSSNTRQAYVQTNEDNIERDIQTEDIEYREKWTQQPPSEIISCGDPNDNKDADDDGQPIDMPRLSAFVDKAAQVMTTLLEEDFIDIVETEQKRSKQSNIIISDAFTELTIPQFLNGRPVITSYFSPVYTHMLLTLHATPSKHSAEPLSRQGCICVWNVNDPDQPQQILMCESRPRCCCFSPTKTNLVFSGMDDGSVVAWDTKEPSSLHRYHKLGDTSWLLRYPTYNTAGVLCYDNHQSPVVAINTIVAPGESASASLGQTNSEGGLSFQLATLEENGVIHLWVVAELSHPDVAGSESDFGLAPGGRIKLVKSSAIQLESPLWDTQLRTTMKCTDMQLLPSNNSHYYVSSDTGCIIHGLRYGGKALPRAYRPVVENLVQVTSIDFSPFPEPVFLAGCEDGTLRLYHTDNEWPLVSWLMSTEARPIRMVRWCRSRPAVFFVLDSTSRLYIWDLLMDDGSPVKQEVISEHGVTNMSLSNDHSATGHGLPGRRPQMVVGLENGCCEIHTMSQQFSALMSDELDQFAAFLQRTK